MSTPAFDVPGLRRSCAHCSLQSLCLPAGVDGDELKRLDDLVQRRRPIPQGQRLFRLGEPMHAVYVAREGAVKTVAMTEDGAEQVLGFHLPGELIGLDGLGSGVHRCEAVALTPTTLCEVPVDALDAVASAVPGLRHQLMRVMGQSMDREQDHKAMLVRRQANERIALFLLSLAERYRRIGRDPAYFRLPMSRHDIANHLGLALETISRGLTRMEEDGLIAVHGRELNILSVDGLERLGNGEQSEGCQHRTR